MKLKRRQPAHKPSQRFQSIPEELRSLRQWVVMRGKVPFNPRQPNRKAKPNNPATWGTFDESSALCDGSRFDGIAFGLTKDDPFIGVDLDLCRDPETGELAPWAEKIVAELDSYTEVSGSGTGLHIIVCGSLPALAAGKHKRTAKLKGVPVFRGNEDAKRIPEIMACRSNTCFKLTGNLLPGRNPKIENRDLSGLCRKYFGSGQTGRKAKAANRPVRPVDGSLLGSLIENCRDADDRSGADYRLCCEAVRHGWPKAEVWERVQGVGKFAERGRDYFNTTWEKAGEAATAGEPHRPSQATTLIELALRAGVELFHAPGESDGFASVPVDGHRENYRLRSDGFRRWLLHQFYREHRSTPASQAVQDAVEQWQSRAMYDGPERRIALRIAEHEGAIWIDLCDEQWRAVRIDADGWRVVTDPLVRFIRTGAMLPLSEPARGGTIDELRGFINAGSDENWTLMLAWLVAAFRPKGPYPALCINGEQGSAKTTASRMLRELVDPQKAGLRSEPKNEHDLMLAAERAWVLAFDNLSHLPPWLSDALCRLCTGGGFGTRQLYSDGEEKLFEATRPVLVNGIPELATRPDLLDRTILLTLPTIPATERRPESDLWERFDAARPRILGALFDAVSVALRNLPSVRLDSSPRLADFALWATAAEPELRLEKGAFMRAYEANREAANETALESCIIAPAVFTLLQKTPEWTGTATELLDRLEVHSDGRDRRQGWPRSPNALSGALKRIAPNLRRHGIEVTYGREGHGGRRIISFRETAAVAGKIVCTVSSPRKRRKPLRLPGGNR